MAAVFAGQRDNIASVIEIGSLHGRSAIAWLELFPTCHITCIDTFLSDEKFDTKTARYADRITKIKSRSARALDVLCEQKASFDLAYIDGDHHLCAVLADSALVFKLVRAGGYMVWDDYVWQKRELDCPRPAIDAFLSANRGRLRVLHKGWQVIAQKRPKSI